MPGPARERSWRGSPFSDTMQDRLRDFVIAALAALAIAAIPASGQTPAAGASTYRPPRTADGKPDLNGLWQVLNTAAWDIQDHSGTLDLPPGQGVVEGNEIPYRPAALKKKQENFANRKTADPNNSCFMPGVPRSTYMPYPFEIIQTPKMISMAYEYAHTARYIPMDGSPPPEAWIDSWMGLARGRWEGDTLVIDVKGFNDQTWFDQAGNFHSDALHVVERYTRTGPDHILYEVTIEDPMVFTRPWKMSMPLYRRTEKNARLLEYECVVYLQEEKYKNAVPLIKK